MSPVVSVIIPTFNRAEYVQLAVRSVLSQTFSDYEIVVVDDGSTDNTREVLASFAHLPNFRYEYQRNQGRSAARNRGIGLTVGELLLFLDSDDLLLPQALEHLSNAAASHPTVGMIVGQTQFVDNDKRVLRMVRPRAEEHPVGSMYPELIRERFALLPGAFVVSRSALARAGNFDSLSEPCEDYDFSLRVALESAVVCIEKPVVQHRLHSGNTPETNIYLSGIKVARKHLKLLETSHSLSAPLRRQSKAAWMLKIADNYYGLDQSPLALKYYMQALRFRPSCADVQLARQMAASLVPVAIRQKLKSLRDTSSK